jgi:hypothetical protein
LDFHSSASWLRDHDHLPSWCAWHERVVFTPRLTERERRQAMLEAREVAARSVARVTHKAA